jgi:hypothetical protein
MTNASGSRRAGVALAAMFCAVAAPAQEVHKCTINGAVSYQATPCPQGDVVLQPSPTPSDQEIRQARVDQSREHFQAATGRIMRPVRVAPPPPPPPPPVRTIVVVPADPYSPIIIQQRVGATRPLTNCELLDRDNEQALANRDQAQAASDLATHSELLKNAQANVARIVQLAAAGNCHLKR